MLLLLVPEENHILMCVCVCMFFAVFFIYKCLRLNILEEKKIKFFLIVANIAETMKNTIFLSIVNLLHLTLEQKLKKASCLIKLFL